MATATASARATGAAPTRSARVLDAFGPDAFDHVLDDVVGQLHRLEHEDQIVLGEVPALTSDGEQLLEAVEGDTNRCRPHVMPAGG
jgi:hypothetical protein